VCLAVLLWACAAAAAAAGGDWAGLSEVGVSDKSSRGKDVSLRRVTVNTIANSTSRHPVSPRGGGGGRGGIPEKPKPTPTRSGGSASRRRGGNGAIAHGGSEGRMSSKEEDAAAGVGAGIAESARATGSLVVRCRLTL
jgi:hypothetical protein